MECSLLERLASRGIRVPTPAAAAAAAAGSCVSPGLTGDAGQAVDEGIPLAAPVDIDTDTTASTPQEVAVGGASVVRAEPQRSGRPSSPSLGGQPHLKPGRSPGSRRGRVACSPLELPRRQEYCPTPLRRKGSQVVEDADADLVSTLKRWLQEARRRLSASEFTTFQGCLIRLAEAKARSNDEDLLDVENDITCVLHDLAGHLGRAAASEKIDHEFAVQFEVSLPTAAWVRLLWRDQIEKEMLQARHAMREVPTVDRALALAASQPVEQAESVNPAVDTVEVPTVDRGLALGASQPVEQAQSVKAAEDTAEVEQVAHVEDAAECSQPEAEPEARALPKVEEEANVEREAECVQPERLERPVAEPEATTVSEAAAPQRPATTVYQFVGGKLVAVATKYQDPRTPHAVVGVDRETSAAAVHATSVGSSSSSCSTPPGAAQCRVPREVKTSAASSSVGVCNATNVGSGIGSVIDRSTHLKDGALEETKPAPVEEAATSTYSINSASSGGTNQINEQTPEACASDTLNAVAAEVTEPTVDEACAVDPTATTSQPTRPRRVHKKQRVDPGRVERDVMEAQDKGTESGQQQPEVQAKAPRRWTPLQTSEHVQKSPRSGHEAVVQEEEASSSQGPAQETADNRKRKRGDCVVDEEETRQNSKTDNEQPLSIDTEQKQEEPKRVSTPLRKRQAGKGKGRGKGRGKGGREPDTPNDAKRRSSCSSPGFERVNSNQEVCSICCEDAPPMQAYRLSCRHGWYCGGCMLRHGEARLELGAVQVPCPECGVNLAERELRRVLPSEFIDRLQARSLEQAVSGTADLRACPTPNCPMRVALEEGEPPRLKCPLCRRESCLRCGAQPYHKRLTCEEYAERRRRRSRGQAKAEELFRKWMEETGTKQCPTCQAPVSKENLDKQGTQYSECHKMMCRVCNTRFCFKCLTLLTDGVTCGCSIDLHGFVNPFTGKRVHHKLTAGAKKAAAKAKTLAGRKGKGAGKKGR